MHCILGDLEMSLFALILKDQHRNLTFTVICYTSKTMLQSNLTLNISSFMLPTKNNRQITKQQKAVSEEKLLKVYIGKCKNACQDLFTVSHACFSQRANIRVLFITANTGGLRMFQGQGRK